MRTSLLIASLALIATSCSDAPKGDAPAPSRFASVKKEASTKAATAFCEKQWPGSSTETGAKKYIEIPEKAVPGAPSGAASAPKGSWKWVNLWATWCLPCVEEMGLLAKWKSSLEKDGVPIDLELWSVDEDEAKLVEHMKKHSMPGRVRWLRAQDDLPGVLESLGADRMSAIPVHALVDGSGNLRCLRVGSVHDEDYGAVKTMLTGA
jgi:thiol-disulfide isomerase/thioredoxin